MTIQLPKLPYAPDALAPAISADTVRYHYEHHHAGYVKTVNRLVKGSDFARSTLDQIIAKAIGPLANAAAQAWNHSFYWNSMTPVPRRPGAALVRAIEQSFGSRVALARRFKKDALQLFGSGWVWLVANTAATLDIVATPNAALRLHEEGWRPLLVCDVWEHAYYLDYRGDRAAYLDAFWQVADWQAASQRFAALRSEVRPRAKMSRTLGQKRLARDSSKSWHPEITCRATSE